MTPPASRALLLKLKVDLPHLAARARATERLSLRTLLMAGGVGVALIGSVYFWLSGGRYVTADDAYVKSAKLMVTTDVSGIVANVAVRDGQQVAAGDVLFELDTRQFEFARDSARAVLAQTALTIDAMRADYHRFVSSIAAQKAQVDLARAAHERSATLMKTNVTSRAAYDSARFGLINAEQTLQSLKQQADAQLARLGGDVNLPVERHPQYLQARAQLSETERQLEHAVVRAPFAGIVTQVDALQRGTFLVSQTAALTNTGAVGLIATDKIWIDANLKETDLTHVKIGDAVTISIDSYPGRRWLGTVEAISPASGAEFALLPAQNASGNWVKVVQRIPVRIGVERTGHDPVLRTGMSAVVSIDTKHRRSLRDLF